MLGKNKTENGKAAKCRKLFSVTIIVAMVLGGFLGIISTDIGSRSASAATTYTISYKVELENQVPNPAGKWITEYTGLENISVSGTYKINDDNSKDLSLSLKFEGDQNRDAIFDGSVTISLVAKWDTAGKFTTCTLNGNAQMEIKYNLFPGKKVTAQLGKLDKALSNIEIDAGAYVGIKVITEIGDTTSNLKFELFTDVEVKEVRLFGYTTADYFGFDIESALGLEYTFATNKWELYYAASTAFKLEVPGLVNLKVEKDAKCVLWESGTTKNNPLPSGGTVTSSQRDFGISGDAGSVASSATDIGVVSYKTTGGYLSTLSSDTSDWAKITPADSSKNIRITVTPANNLFFGSGIDATLKILTDTEYTTTVNANGIGGAETVVVSEANYNSWIKFGIEDTAGLGNYRVDIIYNDVAQAVDIESYGGTGRNVSITLGSLGTKTDTGNGVMFYDVPYGTYTISATEATTGYTGSASVTVNSKLAAFKVKLSVTDPSAADTYDAGTSYSNELVTPYSVTRGEQGNKNWVKISDKGETLYAMCKDVDVNAPAQAWVFFNDGKQTNDQIVKHGDVIQSGGIRLYIYGTPFYYDTPNVFAGVEVRMSYVGYKPNTPLTPSGPLSGYPGVSYFFSTSATDPEGDQVNYGWDWNDDGTVDEWTGLVASGTTVTTPHSWNAVGTYSVKVKVVDSNSMESGWSNAMNIQINSPPPESLFEDNFNDGNCDGWEKHGAEIMEVRDNRLYVEEQNAGGGAGAVLDVDLSKGFIYQADMQVNKSATGYGFGLSFNVRNVAAGKWAGYTFCLFPELDKAGLAWYEETASTWTGNWIAFVDCAVDTNTVYTLKVEKDGMVTRSYVDGEKVIEINIADYAVPQYTDGKIGLMVEPDAHPVSAYFDNVKLWDPYDFEGGVPAGWTLSGLWHTTSYRSSTPGSSYALSFNGVNDYVSVPNSASLRLTSNMAVEAWVYISSNPSDWVRVVGKGASGCRNYGIWYSGPDGRVLFQIYDGTNCANAGTSWGTVVNALSMSPGQWYHLAGVKDGSTIYVYLNGVLVAYSSIGFTPPTSADPLTIGYAGFHTYHKGVIDEVRILNRALTATEISEDYNVVAPYPSRTGTVAWYHMDENIGSVLMDASGYGNNGVIYGKVNDFEGSLTTSLGTWVRTEAGGTLTHVTDYRQQGSYALKQHQEDTSHNAYVEERLKIDLTGKTVTSVRIYNIAQGTYPGSSWWAWAYVAITIGDGTNTYSRTVMNIGLNRENPVNLNNPNTADGSVVGADGRTWYYYDYTIPAGWNKNSIWIELVTDADGGDQGILCKSDAWWDVMTVETTVSGVGGRGISLAYNREDTHTYNTGGTNSGTAIFDLNLKGIQTPYMTFNSWYQTEYTGTYYDYKKVFVSTDGGASWTQVCQVSGTMNTWVKYEVNLAAYAGQSIKVKFEFNTIDGIFNDYEGWYIDDIVIYEAVKNAGFEIAGGWSTEKIGGAYAPTVNLRFTDGPYAGSYYARMDNNLGSMGTPRAGYITQTVTLPSTATTLSYYMKYWKASWGPGLGVRIKDTGGNVLAQNNEGTGGTSSSSGWVQRTFSVSAYAGQTITIEIYLDDQNGYWSGNGDHGGWIGVDAFSVT